MSASLTAAASLAEQVLASFPDQVVRRRVLIAWGVPGSVIDAQLAAGRWRQLGQAVVLHSGPLPACQRRSVALANVGGRALLTSFSGLIERGLRGWDREAVHVLVPFGAPAEPGRRAQGRPPPDRRLGCRRGSDRWSPAHRGRLGGDRGRVLRAAAARRRLDRRGRPAATRDAGCAARRGRGQARHRDRRLLLAALGDIEMGAHALSEIDFAVLCRSLRLPEPNRQAIRVDAQGRNRYLDVEWILRGGTRVVVEIDGALHLRVETYWDDLFRQNDVVLDRVSMVLRFPSTSARTRDPRMIEQLHRALR